MAFGVHGCASPRGLRTSSKHAVKLHHPANAPAPSAATPHIGTDGTHLVSVRQRGAHLRHRREHWAG